MMSSELSLNTQSIRQHADAKVHARGEKLVASGAVQTVARRDDLLTATVAGSGYAAYAVSMQIKDGVPEWAGCTCPYDQGGWCKHIVAVALYAAAHPEEVTVEETVPELLAALTAPDLVRLITELAEASPENLSRVQYFVKNLAAAATQPTVQGSTEVNLTGIQEKIKAGLATDLPPRDVIASDLVTALDLAYAGNAQESMQILRILADGLVKRLKRSVKKAERRDDYYYDRYDRWDYDDEGIDLEELLILIEVGEVWAEACLALSAQNALTPAQTLSVTKDVAAIERRIQSAIGGLADEGIYIANFEEEQDALFLVGVALAQGWYYSPLMPDAVSPIPDEEWYAEIDFTQIRLRVLERMQRYEDYLKLAEEDGEYVALVQMLSYLGRGEEADARALALTLPPTAALEMAKALRTAGRVSTAMQVAERGLDVEAGYGHTALGQWLTEIAHQEGNVELAIKAAVLTLLRAPTLELYKTLRTVAGESWSELRPDVLERLRQIKSDHISGPCEIFLEEELVRDAIQAAPSFVYDPLRHRLFSAAIPVDPDWVIKQAGDHAAVIMNAGNAPRYDEAVAWLRYVKGAYRSTGQANIWTDYLATIRAEHGRKYKLMGLLKTLD